MKHNVIEQTIPPTATLTLEVYGPVNNLSLATALYNWYTDYTRRYDDINLATVIKLLQTQLAEDLEMTISKIERGESLHEQ